MELGANALLKEPSLWGLLPLLIYIVLVFRDKSNLMSMLIGIAVGAVFIGHDIGMIAKDFAQSMGSFVVMIGLIIMLGAGLGKLMNKAGVTKTLVYWIVDIIKVDNQSKAKVAMMIISILICGLLGTLGGGNAVIAPIIIPILSTVGVTPSTASLILKNSGEVGLIWGPLTGVTITLLGLTGLSYGRYMLTAGLPFGIIWLIGTWIGANKIQKATEGKESYEMTEDMKNVDAIVISKQEKIATIAFIISFLLLVIHGIIAKQGTSYVIIVMVILSLVVAIFGRVSADEAEKEFTAGVASMANLFLIFVTIDVLLNMVETAGGFVALSDALNNLITGLGPAAVMLIASVVGGLGIEAAAVAELQIIFDMFSPMAIQAGLPMEMLAVSMLSATRLTGSLYPTSNMVGQMGIAHTDNVKVVLRGSWISVAFVVVYIVVWAFLGTKVL